MLIYFLIFVHLVDDATNAEAFKLVLCMHIEMVSILAEIVIVRFMRKFVVAFKRNASKIHRFQYEKWFIEVAKFIGNQIRISIIFLAIDNFAEKITIIALKANCIETDDFNKE